jgi:hypothetical protein
MYSTGKTSFNIVQTNKIQELLCTSRDKIQRIIHRKGDDNAIIEFSGKVISILPSGWILDYESITEVECSQEEIFMVPNRVAKEETKIDIKAIKVGDYVQAKYRERVIEGEIVQAYNENTLNIIFDNKTKHTAIHRLSVSKILISV